MSKPTISSAEARDLFSAYIIRMLAKAHPSSVRIDRSQEMANALDWAEGNTFIPQIKTEEENFGLLQSASDTICWLVEEGLVVSDWGGWDATDLRLTAEGLKRFEGGDLPSGLHKYLEEEGAKSRNVYKIVLEQGRKLLAHPWWSGVGAVLSIIALILAFV